jgi:hypothetical protein
MRPARLTGIDGTVLLLTVNRWAKIAVAMLLGVSLGMQWTVLQSLAWTTMLISRAGETSFVDAVRTTFDGRHPCSICRVVQKGKDAEKKQETNFTLKKIDATLSRDTGTWVIARQTVQEFAEIRLEAGNRREPPNPPPPRPA